MGNILSRSQKTAEWKKANKEKVLEQKRRYRQKHKAELAEKRKKWNSASPEKRKIYAQSEKARKIRKICKKIWKALNPLKVLEEKRRYNARHPEAKRQYDRDRRARKKVGGGTVTKKEWQAILDKYGHKCLYPDCERTDVTMDHVVPLSRGGTHTADNVQPLCAHHNQTKYVQTVDYRKDAP